MSDRMRERAKTFEQGADAYDELRPQFPDDMWDDVITLAGERLEQGVIEIGAGTGRATLPLARRGARVDVVEPAGEAVPFVSPATRRAVASSRVLGG